MTAWESWKNNIKSHSWYFYFLERKLAIVSLDLQWLLSSGSWVCLVIHNCIQLLPLCGLPNSNLLFHQHITGHSLFERHCYRSVTFICGPLLESPCSLKKWALPEITGPKYVCFFKVPMVILMNIHPKNLWIRWSLRSLPTLNSIIS